MSKEIQVVGWCDGDHEVDTLGPIEREVTIDKDQTMILDLCEVCDKVVQAAQDLAQRGFPAPKVKPRKKAAKRPPGNQPVYEPGVCPESGCGHREPDRNLLRGHVKRAHGKAFADYPGFAIRKGRPRKTT